MDKFEESLIQLEQKGLITIENRGQGDDEIIKQTEFGKWLNTMGMEQIYLGMPDAYQKVLRQAYEDPNGRFDPTIFEGEKKQ